MPELIDRLVGEIADPKLRDQIAEQVKKLKQEKRSGLVFEQHIPEFALQPNLPIKPGARVVKRAGDVSDTFLVISRTDSRKSLSERRARAAFPC